MTKEISIENQVCSLEYAKKLHEIGVKQKSIFVWEYHTDNCYGVKFLPYAVVPSSYTNITLYSAFTAAELLNILPNKVVIPSLEPFDCYRIYITKFISVNEEMEQTNNFIVNYECDSTECHGENAWLRRKLSKNIYDPNLSTALAKLLVYLIKAKLYFTQEKQ